MPPRTRLLTLILGGWLLVGGWPVTSAQADEIYFTSGESLKGLVVEEHVDRLVVSTVDGERVVWRRDVDEAFFDDPERNYLYLGDEALEAGDVHGAVALFQKAAQFNAELEEVRDALRRADDRRRKLETLWEVRDPEAALRKHWGLRLAPTTGGAPKIAVVTTPSFAERAGLQADDQVMAIWGASMAYRPVTQVAEWLLGPSGSAVKLLIQRDLVLSASALPGGKWPGFEPAMTPAGLTVAETGPLGAAAGLRPGDRIVAINGHATRYLPLASVRALLDRLKGTNVSLQIQRALFLTRPGEEGT